MNKYIVYAFLLLNISHLGAVNYAALGTKMGHLFAQEIIASMRHDAKSVKTAQDKMWKEGRTPEIKKLQKICTKNYNAIEVETYFKALFMVLYDEKNNLRLDELTRKFKLTSREKKELKTNLGSGFPLADAAYHYMGFEFPRI